MTTDTPESCCLNCGHRVDAATSYNTDATPSEGDLVACICCGAVMMFGHDLRLRGLSQAEMDDLQANTEAMSLLGELVGTIRMLPKLN